MIMILLLLFLLEYAYACAECNGPKSNFRFVAYNKTTHKWYHNTVLHKQKISKLDSHQKVQNGKLPDISTKQIGATVYFKNLIMKFLGQFMSKRGLTYNPVLTFHVMCMTNFFRKITESAAVLIFEAKRQRGF